MTTSMVGGAEQYLRDLLEGVDYKRFAIYLYTSDQPEFIAYLELDRHPLINHRILDLRDEGSFRTTSARTMQQSAPASWRRLVSSIPCARPIWIGLLRIVRYAVWLSNVKSVERAVRYDQLDILHIVNGGYPGAVSAQAAAIGGRNAGIRSCIMTVSSHPFRRRFPRSLERWIDQRVFASLSKVITPAPSNGAALIEYRGLPLDKLVHIWLGVEIPDPSEPVRLEVRAALGLTQMCSVVGTVCNFLPGKGIATLMRSLAILNTSGNDVYGLFVGDGPYRVTAEALADELGLRKKLIFTGHSSRVNEMLQAMDIFALPSDTEGLSYVILEAMSQSRPVVATSVGGIRDSTVDGETAILVPPRDPVALANALSVLLADPGLADSMGRAGRARFLRYFALADMLERHQYLYSELIATSGKR